MNKNWREYQITEDDAEEFGGYVVYTTEADVEAAGEKANFDLSDGIYSDLDVALMRAKDLSGDYPYHVSTYTAWIKGMPDDSEERLVDIIAEMREMHSLGWERDEAEEKIVEFLARLNGDDGLAEGFRDDTLLTLWKDEICAEDREWYAVMRDNDDNDWGTGSYDLDKAVRMMLKEGKDAYIAVIQHDVCKKEMIPGFWFEVDYMYAETQGGKDRKWALHMTLDESDEVILWKKYADTPGFEGDEEQEPLDTSWAALDDYIKSELGFLPDYEVN